MEVSDNPQTKYLLYSQFPFFLKRRYSFLCRYPVLALHFWNENKSQTE